jgi:hypothetical protein
LMLSKIHLMKIEISPRGYIHTHTQHVNVVKMMLKVFSWPF